LLTIAVEQLPAALSNTISPSFVNVFIKNCSNATGFWVGCIAGFPFLLSLLNSKTEFGYINVGL
jgi:hypothetical protein